MNQQRIAFTVVPRGKLTHHLLFSVHAAMPVDEVKAWRERLSLAGAPPLEFSSDGNQWVPLQTAFYKPMHDATLARRTWNEVLEPTTARHWGREAPRVRVRTFESFGEHPSYGELLQVRSGVANVPNDARRKTTERILRIRAARSARPGQAPENLDRQQVLSSLCDSPSMQRRLGVVFDLVAAVPSTLTPAMTRIRVAPRWAGAIGKVEAEQLFLQTEMQFTPDTGCLSVPFSDGPSGQPGARERAWRAAFGNDFDLSKPKLEAWLPLADATRSLHTYRADCMIDPVRSAMKTSLLERIKEDGGRQYVDQTVGILALKQHSDVLLKYALERQRYLQKQLESPTTPIDPELDRRVDIVDITRGFRPYVSAGRTLKVQGPWTSLCWSRVRHGAGGAGIEEDGCVELSPTLDPADETHAYTSDVLFAWRNWPLCVPPPFESLNEESGGKAKKDVPQHLSRELSEQHRMPPMRFGCHYWFAVVPVSLTGDLLGADPSVTKPSYVERCDLLREDQAGPPEILDPRDRFIDTSERTERVQAVENRTHEVILMPNGPEEDRARWLLAPLVSADLFEVSGALDRADGKGFNSTARKHLIATDPKPGSGRVDNLKGRLTDPSAVGVVFEYAGRGGTVVKTVSFQKPSSHGAVLLVATTAESEDGVVGQNEGYPFLNVRVPEGEEMVVRAHTWIAEAAIATFVAAKGRVKDVRAGKVPELHPNVELTILRPSRAPVTKPVVASVIVHRSLGELSATFDVGAKLHPGSVEHLELLGTWIEYVDGPRTLTAQPRATTLDAINVKTERWDGKREGEAIKWPLERAFRHAFADGRHRVVSLRLRAHAPERFARALGLKASGTRVSDVVKVAVPNVVPPKPIVIDEIVLITSTESSRDAESRAQRWGFRIYMRAGFFESGPGEEVAILEPAAVSDTKAPSASRYVTTFGADPLAGPIAAGATPPSWGRKAPVAEPGKDLQLPAEGGKRVTARRFTPKRTDGRWYIDVDADSGQYYYPFVSLVLARYQPNSVEGAKLSEPTVLEFMQVPAGRTISKLGSGSSVRFSVVGKFREDANVTATVLVPAEGDLNYAKNPERGHLVLDATGLWMPYLKDGKPESTMLAPLPERRSYEGSVGIPATVDPRNASPRWRVIIEETERYLDVDQNAVRRTVWFATYDSHRGFER